MIKELSEYIKTFDENKPDELPTNDNGSGIVYVFDKLIHACNNSSKNRIMNIINKQALFNILFEQFKKQKMRCAYSNVKMSLHEMIHDFAMSVERINEKLGYIKDNVLLVCKEFNTGQRQWSKAKITELRGF
jgi:cupin superfamily acireductone dioxygenase involved in methionine salvage